MIHPFGAVIETVSGPRKLIRVVRRKSLYKTYTVIRRVANCVLYIVGFAACSQLDKNRMSSRIRCKRSNSEKSWGLHCICLTGKTHGSIKQKREQRGWKIMNESRAIVLYFTFIRNQRTSYAYFHTITHYSWWNFCLFSWSSLVYVATILNVGHVDMKCGGCRSRGRKGALRGCEEGPATGG